MKTKVGMILGILMLLTFNAAACYITVYKFNDSNGNGVKESNENKLADFTFTVIANGFNRTITTNAQGKAVIQVNNNKNYTVTEIAKAGWVSTTANPQIAVIKNGNDVALYFGNRATTTTTTTCSSTTTTIPTAPEFGFAGMPLAALLIAPAFAYLAVRRKE